MGYFRELVENDLRLQYKAAYPSVTLPDFVANPTACFVDTNTVADPFTYAFPPGCTGFEQMMSSSVPTNNPPKTWEDYVDVTIEGFTPLTVFTPGDPQLHFVADPVNTVVPDLGDVNGAFGKKGAPVIFGGKLVAPTPRTSTRRRRT